MTSASTSYHTVDEDILTDEGHEYGARVIFQALRFPICTVWLDSYFDGSESSVNDESDESEYESEEDIPTLEEANAEKEIESDFE